MTKTLTTLLGGGMLLAMTACGEKDIPGNCQPTLADDPDCLVDGLCALEDCHFDDSCGEIEPVGVDDADLLDRNDPDCDVCLLEDPGDYPCDEECDYAALADDPDCECELNPDLPKCDPRDPVGASMTSVLAYDSENNNARSYFLTGGMGDVEVQPYFTVLVEGAQFEATNNPAFQCFLLAEATGTLDAAPFSAEITTQASRTGGEDTREYVGTGVTFASGSFTVADEPRDTQGGRIPGCSEWYIDPAKWGNESTGIQDAVSGASWQFAWTNMAPVITEIITDPASNTADPFDTFDLYGDGENFIVGGTMSKPGAPTNAQTAYYYSEALDVDADWKLVPQDGDDPFVRIPWDEMLPEGDAKPKSGVYQVTSFNRWNASYIFLDQSGG